MRSVIRLLVPAAVLLLAATPGQAQEGWKPELRPFVGTTIPTGTLRDVIGSETHYGLQVAGELRWWLHAVGTVGWAPAETRYVAQERGLDVLQYDVGLEVNGRQPLVGKVMVLPFWGAGAGARTYRYDAAELRDRTCVAGYVSTGVVLQLGRVAGRAEARDNVLCYRSPLASEQSGTRNDLAFTLGLVYHLR